MNTTMPPDETSRREILKSWLREKQREGMAARAERGEWPAAAPVGYETIGRSRRGGSRIVPNPRTAPLIRLAFELYATGRYTLDDLCRLLAQRGLHNRFGRRLRPGGVAQLLQNPFYAGIICWGGGERPGIHLPLISQELFDAVQVVRRQRHLRGLGDERGATFATAAASEGLAGSSAAGSPVAAPDEHLDE